MQWRKQYGLTCFKIQVVYLKLNLNRPNLKTYKVPFFTIDKRTPNILPVKAAATMLLTIKCIYCINILYVCPPFSDFISHCRAGGRKGRRAKKSWHLSDVIVIVIVFVIVSVLVSSCAVVFVVVVQLCLALTQNNGKHFSTFHFSHRLAQGEVCRERENAGGRAQVRQADIA